MNESTEAAPIGSSIVASANETSIAAVSAAAKAQVEARLIIARRFPRDLDEVRQKILKDCRRPLFADGAEYKRPIGGEQKKGPSIRFMESAAMAFGNIDIQTPVLYDDDKKRQVRVVATDLESNTAYSQDFTFDKTVERKFLKKGQKAIKQRRNSNDEILYIVEATDDEVFIKQNALASKIVRNLIKRLIPSDLIDEGIATARATLRDHDKADPDASRKRIADSFDSIGVPIKELKELLGHDLAGASPVELENLRSIYAQIRDGDLTWDEVLTKVREKRARQSKEEKKKADKEKAEIVDPNTGEVYTNIALIEVDSGIHKGHLLGELDEKALELLIKTASDHIQKAAAAMLSKLRESQNK